MKLALALVSAALLTGCSEAASHAMSDSSALAGRLVVTGSSTIAPLADELARRFERRHPAVRVEVHSGGTSRGIADVRAGAADLGMASRDLGADERDLTAYPIARDGICWIVHPSNAVPSLREDQIRAIYTGRVTRWSEVGGRDAPITVVSKAEGRATLEVFLAALHLAASDLAVDVVVGENEQAIKTVAGNANAIGFVSIGTAEVDVREGVAIRMLPARGVDACLENVENGTFPMTRSLHLIVASDPSPLARAFLDFARSAEVHDIIRAQSFAPAGH